MYDRRMRSTAEQVEENYRRAEAKRAEKYSDDSIAGIVPIMIIIVVVAIAGILGI